MESQDLLSHAPPQQVRRFVTPSVRLVALWPPVGILIFVREDLVTGCFIVAWCFYCLICSCLRYKVFHKIPCATQDYISCLQPWVVPLEVTAQVVWQHVVLRCLGPRWNIPHQEAELIANDYHRIVDMIERIIRIYDIIWWLSLGCYGIRWNIVGTSQYYFMNRSWTVLKYNEI